MLSSGTGSAEYYVIDSSSSDGSFVKSKYSLDQSSSGALMQTTNQIYGDSSIALALYNDEPPPSSTESSTYAHAKGILIADADSAAWIVHSKPHWPDSDAPAPLPDFKYAQSFMCVTLTLSEFENISSLLSTSYPYFYKTNLPDSLDLPNFSALISKTKVDNTSSQISFGHGFTAFAKSRTWGKDLWEDLVAPSMGAGMYVETWRDGSGGRMPSFCKNSSDPDSGHSVSYDILFVNQVNMTDASWSGTKDHSKWGVGTNEKFACVGDINRMCSQESRGGGALCLENDNLASAFSKVVGGYDGCWG
eukprot:CAMPEP_0197556460 /NCGR_PEP_ID=MMETSP1320-20131121/15173_1 /TAXON_ID=91990 /ORGANISM="Bolidomonas sp., Strain RCC2347" /LENGTH=304 /DNA_ID=CAMNT_0043117593 /DNA_START=1 /DNA_END=911 /DNA_ORIENTATION=+